jgi:hypothetical protein
MKKLYILLLFAGFYQAADAQVYIEREVVSSGGDNFISGQIILTSTIGEIATETLGNMQFHMTQGFQQSGGLVVPSSRYVSYEGGVTSFMVLAPDSVNWVATCAEDWCEITYSGSGIGTITATYTSNELFVPRSANILVDVENIGTVIVTVHQARFPIIIDGYPNVQSVSAEAGFTTFSITSNTSWRVVENIDWINIDPMVGDSIQELTVTYDTNYSAYERTGEFIIIADSLDYFIVLSVVQEGATPYLTINPDTINVGSGSGSTAFSIESNVNWMIDTNEVWFDVNPESGSNMQVITIDYNENISIAPRSGIVSIYSDIEDIGDTFVINQDGAFVYIVADPEFAEVNADSGTISVTLTSNAEWIVNEHSDWFSINPLSANGDETLTITYESNPFTVTRSGKVFLETLGGTVTTSITIIQSGAEPTLAVTPLEQQVGHQQGSIDFNVSSNTGWTVATNANWLEIDPFEGYLDQDFTVFYDENLLASPRSVTITISTTDDTLEFEVILHQSGAPPTISVSPSFQEVGFEAGTCTLTVSSNDHWTASTNVPWLTLTPNSGELDGIITVSFAENPFALSRQGVIIFTDSDETTETSVIIEQAAAPVFLSVIPEFIEVTSETGITEVDVLSNANWEITFIDDWLEASPLTGFGTETLTITYESNPFTATRSGKVFLETLGGTVTTSITIIQTGSEPTLVVTPSEQQVGHQQGSINFNVSSNTGWTVATNANWLEIDPFAGYLDQDFTVFYDENLLAAPRSATITISTTDDTLEFEVILHQLGAPPTISVSPSFQEVGFEAGTCTLTVSSNDHWTASTNVPWLTLTPNSGELDGIITVSFAENPFALSRQGVIIFTDSNETTETSVIIEQAAAPAFLSVIPEFIEVTSETGITEVDVLSNANWQITFVDVWLEASPLTGFGTETLIITYESNPFTIIRSGKVFLETLGGTVTTSITIIQSGAEPTLAVTPSEQQVGHQQGSIDFNVSSNTGWTVATNANWLEIDPFEGYLDQDFTVFYDENLLAASRSVTITISTTDDTLEFEVILHQSGAPPTISVSPTFQEVGFEAGTCTLTVSSNDHWTASTNVPWLTLTPNSGELDGIITVSFAENPFALSRQGVITFTTSDGIAETSVIIEQAAAPAFLSVIPEFIEVTSETGITEVDVLSNANWEITFVDAWLEASPLTGFGAETLIITYESNPFTVTRSGKVFLETLGGTVTTSVTIIQSGAEPTLAVTPSEQQVGHQQGSIDFNVSSNTGWTVATNANWLEIDPFEGYLDQDFTVFYDENLLAAPRSATITISTTDDTLEFEVILHQLGAPPTISVSPSFQEVGFEAGTCTLTVSSNDHWTASTNVPWLTLTPNSGELDGIITVSFAENPFALSRQGVIIFTDSNETTETSVIIEQAAAPAFLSVIPEFIEVTSETGITEVDVLSNANWEITFVDAWLEASPLTGFGAETLIITYESNPFTVTRSGKVFLETLGGTVTTSVTIIQSGAEPTLAVTPSEQQVGHQQGSIDFNVSSNTGWTVATNANWLEIDPFEGYLDQDFTVFYDENLLAASRSATITISTTDDILEFEAILYQSGAPPTISVSPSFQEVGFEAGTCTLTVSSNDHWTASTNVPWLTLTPNSGELDGIITVSFAENPLALSRQGVITFTTSDGMAEASVIIEQVAAPAFLSVMPLELFVDFEAGITYFTIISNALWEISNSETWLHAIPESGIGNATITLYFDVNYELPRQGLIYIDVSGLPSEVVTINQATPFILILEPDSLTVGPSSGIAYLSVISNTNWTAESNVPWLQVSPVNGSDNDTITLTFNANITDSVRIAEISVFSAGLPVRKSYLLQLPGQGTERVILPELIAGTNAIIEIPVMVSDLTGYGIITNEFVFSYDPSVLIPSPPYVITIGTMLGDAGWTLIIDQQEAGNLSVVALGSEPLSGSGVLTKLKFKVIGEQGSSSDLSFDEFVFNGNNPLVEITNGLLNVPIRNCGDVDENGFVQAYDASLALKHSIGLITLSPIGAYNADVNEDNLVRAFDAALILRAAINLPMPPGVSTCFNYDNITVGTLEYDFKFNAVLRNYEKQYDFINAEILFTGITRPERIFSISFDVTNPVSHLNSVEFIDLPPGYSVFTNKISERIIRIAIIHPMGILSQDLNLRVLIGHCGTVSLALKDVVINDHEFPDILISDPFSSSLSKGGALLTAYPNPFRASTTIAYEVIENGNIEIEIIDLFGRSVDVLYRGMQDEGFYNLTWDGKSKENGRLPQGWYIVRMKTENYIQQVRISLIR